MEKLVQKKFRLNSRGQSSVADALFFFTVAAGLALFLLVFGTNYGTGLQSQTEKEQFREYVSSATKVILYSSTPRDPNCNLDDCPLAPPPHPNPPHETDFLMAAVKEDFADDGGLDETAGVLKNNLRAIMQPVANSVDYIFFIYMKTQPQTPYPYFLFYKSVFDSAACEHSLGSGGGAFGGCHVFYYCKPTSSFAVDRFFFSLPGISKTSSNTIFLAAPIVPGQVPSQVPSEIHFAVWPSTRFNDSPDSPFFALNCCDPNYPLGNNCYASTFTGPGSVGGGLQFFVRGPNDSGSVTLRYNGTGWDSAQIKFVVVNNDSADTGALQVRETSTSDCVSKGWLALPPSIASLKKVENVPKADLLSTNQFMDQGYFIRTSFGDTEWSTANKLSIVQDYDQAPDDYPIRLFQKAEVPVTVIKPSAQTDPSFMKYCSFELEGRPVTASIIINVEQPSNG